MATTELPRPALPEAHEERRGGLVEWVTTVDHKKVGLLYIFTAVAIFALGGSSRWWSAPSWPTRALGC
jgi:cytochrome c oxidase subunit I